MNRREFLQHVQTGMLASLLPTWSLPTQPPFRVIVPDFAAGHITEAHETYLNQKIPALFHGYRPLFPVMQSLPTFVIVNTMAETLQAHGGTRLVPHILGEEALTLSEVQQLLVTTRFGSIATPHRGPSLDHFGKVIYIKQYPERGYEIPEGLLLEELVHAQQDLTVMRHIIQHADLDPTSCLHAELKGISELGAHYYVDSILGEADYVFVMDDGTWCETATEGIQIIAERLGADMAGVIGALLYDTETYAALDAIAVAEQNRHIWEMVTTWRPSRDADGNIIEIAPAYQPFESS